MSDVDKAVELFGRGYSCSQAILMVYGSRVGIEREMAIRIAAGFSGGMRMGETCGAVTGAIMVLGLLHGSTDAQDKKARKNMYESVNRLVERFRARNGSVVCKKLLGVEIDTEVGMKTAEEKGLFSSVCPEMVRAAAEILEEMFNDNQMTESENQG